jgi:hypothetical protein
MLGRKNSLILIIGQGLLWLVVLGKKYYRWEAGGRGTYTERLERYVINTLLIT